MMFDPADESLGADADIIQPTTDLALTLAVMRYRYKERGVQGWMLMSTVAYSLCVEISATQGAARVGVDNGWMISNEDPGDAVCLTDYGSAKAQS